MTHDEVVARLRMMCAQVGHPDYSLAEFVRGVLEVADALESSPPAPDVSFDISNVHSIDGLPMPVMPDSPGIESDRYRPLKKD